MKINAKGGRIEVLTEGDFLALTADTTTSGVRVPHQREAEVSMSMSISIRG